MKRVIKLVLPVDPHIFKPTIEAYTKGYNLVCAYGFENKEFNKLRLHHQTYKYLRTFLPADLAISARVCAYGTLKALKSKIKLGKCKIPFSKNIPIQYSNNKSYSINFEKKTISLLTIQGRVKIPLPFIPQHFLKYLTWNRKGAKLIIKNNKVYLNINYEKEVENQPITNPIIIGLDRGINNISVLSNNKFYSGKNVKKYTQRIRKIRSKLQSIGSKSAKRHLKKISHKENGFRRDINHQISKQIIKDLPAGSTIVIEDLNCRTKKKLGKRFNKQLNSWAYYQLEQFLTYKAEEKQIKIVKVDPSYTSQKCSKCGHTKKKNRNGSNFKCLSCGFQINADLNASRNIKQNWLEEQVSQQAGLSSISLLFQPKEILVRNKPQNKFCSN